MTLLTVSMTLLRCFVRISDSPPWSCQGWSWCWKRFLWGTGNLVTGVGGVGGWWVLGVRGTFWQMLLIHLSPACPCTCSRLYFFDGCIKNSNSRLYPCSIKTREVLGNPSHQKCEHNTYEHNTNLWTQHKHMNTTPTCGWDEKGKLVEKRCLRLPPGLQSYPLQHLDRLHLRDSYIKHTNTHSCTP